MYACIYVRYEEQSCGESDEDRAAKSIKLSEYFSVNTVYSSLNRNTISCWFQAFLRAIYGSHVFIMLVQYIPPQNISPATNYSILTTLFWNHVTSVSVFNSSIVVLRKHVCALSHHHTADSRLCFFRYIWSHPLNTPCLWALTYDLFFLQLRPFDFQPFNVLNYLQWQKWKGDNKQRSGVTSPDGKPVYKIRNQSRSLPVAGLGSFYFRLVISGAKQMCRQINQRRNNLK